MSTGAHDLHRLLVAAWQLWDRLDFPGIIELLRPLDMSELIAEPELGFLLAYSRRHIGDWEGALPIVELLADACARRGNDRLYRRRMNLEGMIWFDRGELGRAEEIWKSVLDAAHQAGDSGYIADLNNNLGTIADIQCNHVTALAFFQRALVAHRSTPNLQGIVAAHSNIGMSYRQLGFLDQAEFHFEQAIASLHQDGADSFRAGCEMERAILLTLRGDTRLAGVMAGNALRRYRKLRNRAGEGDTLRVLGIIAVAQGRRADARALFGHALQEARWAEDRLVEAETLEEMAVLDLLEDKESAAEHANGASALYRQIGTEPRAARVQRRLDEVRERSSVATAG